MNTQFYNVILNVILGEYEEMEEYINETAKIIVPDKHCIIKKLNFMTPIIFRCKNMYLSEISFDQTG